ncbi:MAG: glycosyltransferase family 4 protein, partial [Bacteroidales bacterium]|nr:glycosyltransferase family 4 protein [Bacteroidales bacterium]
KIDLFIAPSKFMMNKVEEMGLNYQITHLYNFIDIFQYEPVYSSEGKTICYFGRLSPEKGLFTLIEAMKDVDGELKIIGDGPLRSDLEENVRIGNMTNVSFLGYRKGDELQKEIKESRAVVIPSECYENNPRTVIESFAMGKPVIGSEIGGIPELVRNNITGYTYQPGDPHDLKEKMTLMLNDVDKCIEMGNNGRKLVESEFSEERHYHKLMKIYESLIDR